MGAVYRALDTRLGREVAVKVLPPEVTSDQGRLERLKREAKVLAALNQPGIVTIYSLERVDGEGEESSPATGHGARRGRDPDSSRVAVHRAVDSVMQIFTVAADGSGLVQVTGPDE